MPEPLLTRYLQPLLAGRRAECFELIRDALPETAAEDLLCDIVWPATVQIERLYRDDKINTASEHVACRINHTAIAQLQPHLPARPPRGKRAIVASANRPCEELGAELIANLFQADGWDVTLAGGGVPCDEILTLVGQLRPHLLLIFGADPEAVPETRRLVELIREVGVCSTMNIMVTGGIFGRADGLWQEVGADVYCGAARETLRVANDLGPRAAQPMRLGIVKRRRRRRKVAVPA